MAQIVNSLAKTGRKYVVLQARAKEGRLHIQGAGPEVNRNYGVSVDILPSEFRFRNNSEGNAEKLTERDYIAQLGEMADKPSMAGTKALYFEIRLRPETLDGSIKGQIKSDIEANRPYGASFKINAHPILETFLTTVLNREAGSKIVETEKHKEEPKGDFGLGTPDLLQKDDESDTVTVRMPRILRDYFQAEEAACLSYASLDAYIQEIEDVPDNSAAVAKLMATFDRLKELAKELAKELGNEITVA